MAFGRRTPPPDPVPAGDGQSIAANMTGAAVANSQVALGSDITQVQTVTSVVTQAERDELHGMIEALSDQIAAAAPREQVRAALKQVDELEQATLDEPDVSKIKAVGRWFATNLPGMLGAVTSVVVHPVVGKLVGAGGDMLVDEFRKLAADEA